MKTIELEKIKSIDELIKDMPKIIYASISKVEVEEKKQKAFSYYTHDGRELSELQFAEYSRDMEKLLIARMKQIISHPTLDKGIVSVKYEWLPGNIKEIQFKDIADNVEFQKKLDQLYKSQQKVRGKSINYNEKSNPNVKTDFDDVLGSIEERMVPYNKNNELEKFSPSSPPQNKKWSIRKKATVIMASGVAIVVLVYAASPLFKKTTNTIKTVDWNTGQTLSLSDKNDLDSLGDKWNELYYDWRGITFEKEHLHFLFNYISGNDDYLKEYTKEEQQRLLRISFDTLEIYLKIEPDMMKEDNEYRRPELFFQKEEAEILGKYKEMIVNSLTGDIPYNDILSFFQKDAIPERIRPIILDFIRVNAQGLDNETMENLEEQCKHEKTAALLKFGPIEETKSPTK